MDKFLLVSKILKETMNCAAGMTSFESPARPFKQEKKDNDKHSSNNTGTKLLDKQFSK